MEGISSSGYLQSNQVTGDLFSLSRTNAKHFGSSTEPMDGNKSFGQMLMDSVSQVNDDQQYASEISILAASDPNSVEAHDVTIALAKANMSLSIAKNVIDRVVQAYQDITSLR